MEKKCRKGPRRKWERDGYSCSLYYPLLTRTRLDERERDGKLGRREEEVRRVFERGFTEAWGFEWKGFRVERNYRWGGIGFDGHA